MTSAVYSGVRQSQRDNVIRDTFAVALLALGFLLPWNLQSGVTIGISGAVLGLLIVVTLLSVAAVALTHAGPFADTDDDADHVAANRIRLLLNVPYLLTVAGFVVVAVVQSFATGSSADVPPGIGPGALLGLGGALLAAQPVATGPDRGRTVRLLALASLGLGGAAVLFTLHQRTRFVLPAVTDSEVGMQNTVVALTALLYAVVAIVPVVIVARWMRKGTPDGWLATTLIAGSMLTAATLVWVFPVGRDVDAFHGITQSTSTAGVGYEGYLVWVAVAALIGSGTVKSALHHSAVGTWQSATRKCLVLIAAWCGGTAALRIADLLTSAVLDLPSPPYNATALMAADLLIAVLALWLLVNSSTKAASRFVFSGLFGVLFVAVVCRLVLGVALVPRVRPLNPGDINDVYGNTLVQQITGTFDVALCALALILLVVAATAARPHRADLRQPSPQPVPSQTMGSPVDTAPPTIAVPRGGSPARDRAAEVLTESTQRFAAGTTYGSDPRTASGDPHEYGR